MEKVKLKKHKICIIGTGYVGLVSGTCFAKMGHTVICVDNNKAKIDGLQKGICPIYEPGLPEMISENIKKRRLFFSTNILESVRNSDIIFIAVHTPTKENGETDLQYVEGVAKEVALSMNKYKVIVSKSTMPVKTGQKIKEIVREFIKKGVSFDVVSNPEFLREGSAVRDFLHADRIVIGAETKRAKNIMQGVYGSVKAQIIFTDIESAEIIKHACNAFLATKISFINAIANICEHNGANVDEVAMAMGLDKRIGADFLKAGIGFGGSCFPKDVSAFINVAEKNGYDFSLLKEVKKINKKQREIFLEKIIKNIPNIDNKKIAVWGLSFKADTDDMRESPAIDIVKGLVEEGASIRVFDPAAMEKAKEFFGDKIAYCKTAEDALVDCDALIILTDWDVFKNINLRKVRSILKTPKIIDGRNIFNHKEMKKLGFDYYSIGRK